MNVLQCGSCVHFAHGPAHPDFETICQDRGIKSFSSAPGCYSPAPHEVINAPVKLSELGAMLRKLTSSQMHVLGQLMTQAGELELTGFKFGQPVYVSLGTGPDGLDYLTSYFKGYVIGCATVPIKDQKPLTHIYIASNLTVGIDELPDMRVLLRMLPKSLLTSSGFLKRKAALLAEERLECSHDSWKMPLKDWLAKGTPGPDTTKVLYEPPTLDTAPSSWLDPYTPDDVATVKKVLGGQGVKDVKKSHKLKVNTVVSDNGSVVKVVNFSQEETQVPESWAPVMLAAKR